MRKLRFNKLFLLSLIAAFIFLQWSATHIHLAGEHEHDGDQHQHTLIIHQHQQTSQHIDVIDIAGNSYPHNDGNVVEIDHVCSQFHGKLDIKFAIIPSVTGKDLLLQSISNSIVTSYIQNSYQRYYQYSSVRLRAPPLTA